MIYNFIWFFFHVMKTILLSYIALFVTCQMFAYNFYWPGCLLIIGTASHLMPLYSCATKWWYCAVEINGPYLYNVDLGDIYAHFLQTVLTKSHDIILQVHRAVLHNGERVAVKVQRPGLKKLFDIDLSKRHICCWCS
jgi:hypothetical protein